MKYIMGNSEFNLEESLDKFFESFNTPVGIDWVENNSELIGSFMVNDKIYQIKCKHHENDIWTYKFYIYDEDKNDLDINLTNFNTGFMSVLSTVKVGMKYLIENKIPKSVIFGAIDESKGRKILYHKFSNELSDEYDFELTTNKFKNKQIFILHKNIDKQILFETVELIIEELFNEI